MNLPLSGFDGHAWRGHNPRWAFTPESGEGAAVHGGRFNRQGRPALYLALSPEGAVREVQAGFAHRFQPLTLCSYEVVSERIADARAPSIQAATRFSAADLACAWRLDCAEGREPASWRLAEALEAAGAHGMFAPSFAPGARADDVNLVLWRWNDSAGTTVRVIDDHGRLPADSGGAE